VKSAGTVSGGRDVLLSLSEAGIEPSYFLIGPNAWLMERIFVRLRQLAVPGPAGDINAETIWAGETGEEVVGDFARTPPFGGGRRFILVRDAGEYRPKGRSGRKQAEDPPLAAYLRNPMPTTVLVLADGHWEVDDWEGHALFEAALRAGVVAECARPTPGELRDWLASRAGEMGMKLEPGVSEEMMERVGEEQFVLERELEKMAAWTGGRAPVSHEDIAALTGDVAPPSVFRFLDVLFVERHAGRALAMLGKLLFEMHPLQLHSLLAGQIRKLIHLKSALEEGLPQGAIAARVKLPYRLVPSLGLMVKRVSGRRFAELLRALATAEAALKRGRDGRIILEGLVLECCSARPR